MSASNPGAGFVVALNQGHVFPNASNYDFLIHTTGATKKILIGYSNAANPATMVITNNSVGIGTSNPIDRLQVVGGGIWIGNQMYWGSTAYGGNTLCMGQGSNMANTASNWPHYGIGLAPSGHLWAAGYYGLHLGTNGASRMIIHQSGRMGINTSSFSNLLSVAGNASIGASYANVAAPTNSLIVQGNVGIGTTSPSNMLSVNASSTLIGSTMQVSHGLGDWGIVVKRTANDAGTANIALLKSRGETAQNIQQGDAFGRIAWHGVTSSNAGTVAHVAEIVVSNSNFDPSTGLVDANMMFSTKSQVDGTPIERMRITNTGNVGIGSSNPSFKLHVEGEVVSSTGVRAYSNASTGFALLSPGSTSYPGFINFYAPSQSRAGYIGWAGNNNNYLVMHAENGYSGYEVSGNLLVDGLLGIGTTAPTSKLDVYNAASNNVTLLTVNSDVNATGFSKSTIVLRKDGRGDAYGGEISGYLDQGVGSGLVFSTINAGTSVEQVRIKNNGYVGIGTSNPSANLEVNGTIKVNTLQIGQLWTGSGNASYWNNGANGDWYIRSVSSAGSVIIQDSGGNVGVGTTSPATTLEIKGYTPYTNMTTNPIGSSLIVSTTTGGQRLYLGAYYTGGVGSACAIQSSDFFSSVDHAQPLILNPLGGNIGIGTTSPSHKLHVYDSTGDPNILVDASGGTGQAGIKLKAGSGSTNRATRIDMFALAYTSPAWTLINDCDQNGTNDLRFVFNNGVTSALTLLQNGNVGIGTNSPAYLLDINGNSRFLNTAMMCSPSNGAALRTGQNPQNQSVGGWTFIGLNVEQNIFSKSAIGKIRTGPFDIGDIVFLQNASVDGTDCTMSHEKMRITSGGNIGIGTSSPGYKLQVNGATAIYQNATNMAWFNFLSSGDGYETRLDLGDVKNTYRGLLSYNTNTSSPQLRLASVVGKISVEATTEVTLRTGGSERMRITSTGNVGIGTSSPMNQFVVQNLTARTDTITTALPVTFVPDAVINRHHGSQSVSGFTYPGPALSFRTYNGANTWDLGTIMGATDNLGGSATSGGLSFYTAAGGAPGGYTDGRNSGGAQSLALALGYDQRVYMPGNVGIGTTSPGYKLHVESSVDGELGSTVKNTSSGVSAYSIVRVMNNTGACVWFMNSSSRSADGGVNTATIRNDGGDLRLQAAGGVPAIHIKATSGNIGINTTAPAGKLHIALGDATASGNTSAWDSTYVVFGSGSTSTSPGLGFGYNASLNGNVLVSLQPAIAWKDMYYMAYSHYWKVGNTSWLQLTSAGSLVCAGDVSAFGSISDRNLKTNITSLSSSLDIVNSLRPVTFQWREDIFHEAKRGQEDVGFIAQEVEPLIPLAVGEYTVPSTKDTYKNLKHERILPYVVGAVQELANHNTSLNNEVAMLKEENKELKDEIYHLKQYTAYLDHRIQQILDILHSQ